ncbi:hypothetical protein EJV47_11990 [Hymenobacter gummosus]|uniref:Erythromycin esterase family protein n=1 Tax=Hymenobacter gummosus TaxID=1776032 RepID=A0A431U2G5_9BACT|nr:erythromycin esterase family protein [Hymenobacter gummosus]RTQ49541.1 hypothetical protein EJV47_11990 [Hymenobacter gummosus]
MFSRLFCLGCVLGLLSWFGAASHAQQLPAGVLPAHPVRSISPADEDFTDLAFLPAEIGAARVVMLGEPTHGEGSVTEAKIRLLRFLQRRMGFTTVAFESGFYEVGQAQRLIEAGTPVREALAGSLFPIWTGTQEFQAIQPLLGSGGLRVAGFDNQLSGEFQGELLEELEAFLQPEKGAQAISYDYLDECISAMGEMGLFPPTHQPALFNAQLNKARRLLEKVAGGPQAARRERAAFWLQTLRSLQALAHDYAQHDNAAKDSASFRAADSNPRDAQMADNLLWYLRQHPQEKVVCWGALPHFANRVEAFDNAELRAYQPMGRAVKAALGPDAVYVLGTLAGGGSHRFGGRGPEQLIPPPAAGSLEAELLSRPGEYQFVSLKHDAPGRVLTTYAFEYRPLSGPWSEVVDGFLFLRNCQPPHPVQLAAAPETAPAATPAAPPTSPARPLPGPVLRPRGPAGSAVLTLSGTIIDRRSGQPVPFATVALPAEGKGAVADAQGRFQLAVPRGATVQVSSIGYETVTLPAAAVTGRVQLTPAAYALGPVRVTAQSQDPRRILKKVIAALPTNYETQDYTAQLYTRRRLIRFDTLRFAVEYVSQIFEPAGFRSWDGGFLMLGPQQTHQVQQKHVLQRSARPLRSDELMQGGHGFFSVSTDPVRISPLFRRRALSRYQLRLDSIEQHGGETYYRLRFEAKRPNHRTTGSYLTSGYAGTLLIRQQDYAVVRYEARWQYDTVQHNAVARKYHGRPGLVAQLYNEVYSASWQTHTVEYQRGANGRYHALSSLGQALTQGHVLGGAAFYDQKSCEQYLTPLPAGSPHPDHKLQPELEAGELQQLTKVPERPEFWDAYQRPVPAAAPTTP